MTEHALIGAEDAEEYTQSLGQIFGGSWRQIAWAERQGIPSALGLTTEEWVTNRLGGYVRLAVSERREAARELADEGMSQRGIAAALGVSQKTVDRDLEPESNDSPAPAAAEEPQVASSRDLEPESNDSPAPAEDDLGDTEGGAGETLPPEPESPKQGAHVGKNSGDNEWYTPAEYIKAATAVMGGIDLDPASSAAANEVIGAAEFYAEDDDGMDQPWAGRVWMNPPYAQPLVDRFCTRLAREFRDGAVEEACVLVNNATETHWFQEVLGQASAACFPRGRIRFWHPSKEAVPLQGQAIIYLGPHTAEFKAEFLRFGPVGMF